MRLLIASTKVCPAIASRRITLEEYGVRFPDMNSDDSAIRTNEYGRAKEILIDFDNPLGIRRRQERVVRSELGLNKVCNVDS